MFTNAFHDPSCHIDLCAEESVSACLCFSALDGEFPVAPAVSARQRDAAWLQAEEERRGE